MDAARVAIAADRTAEATKMLARIARIFEQPNSAWDVLRTMTPSEPDRLARLYDLPPTVWSSVTNP